MPLRVGVKTSLKLATFGIFAFCVGYFFYKFFYTDSLLGDFRTSRDPFAHDYSKILLDRNNELLSVFLNQNEQWHLKASAPIPHKLKVAVLEYEDKRFFSHIGVDFLAIARTLKKNFSHTKRAGASTITMQVAKFLNNKPRTYKNKIDEIIYATRLEWLYSKDEILELYLNNASYGRNLLGFSSALLFYFGLQPHQIENLTWAQAALLAVLPNVPGLINLEKNPNALKAKRNFLLERLHKKGHFDAQILRLAKNEPIPSRFVPRKNLAPHLALRLFKDSQNHALTSSVDKQIQNRFESRAKQYAKRLQNEGIANLSALLIDTQSKEVLAYVGSQDFFDMENYGQIDGIQAYRSPGSTLKPLLYALSIDEGLLHPYSKLIDIPLSFGAFAPQNASKRYHGLISAQNALTQSLNIPFVHLLQEYGYEKFFFTLKDILGFSDEDYARYGLSLILGTKELSVEDIATIYLGLGNYGLFEKISYFPRHLENPPNSQTAQNIQVSQNTSNPARRFLSEGAAYLTLMGLERVERVGLENFHKDKKIFAWKSGTSYGRKDAWAAGTSPKYTLVVWVGNFTGESNSNLFGAKSAGGLLFELLGELEGLDSDFVPKGLKPIALDSPTGYALSDELKELGVESLSALYPIDSAPLRVSPFLQSVWVDMEGNEVNSLDSRFLQARKIARLNLPINVLNYYNLQNINLQAHLRSKPTRTLRILYPSNGLKIIEPIDFEGKQKLIIRLVNLKKQKLFLYIDSQFFPQSAETTTIESTLEAGVHTIYVVGEDGSEDSVSFEIVR